MTDIECIHEIEKIVGFKLKQLPIEKLSTDDALLIKDFYITNKIGSVIGLSLDYFTLLSLTNNFLDGFGLLIQLSLRNIILNDYSFLLESKGITMLVLSNNEEIKDYSFLKELKRNASLNLSSNDLKDASFLKELKGITSLNLSNNKEIKDYSFLKELKGITSLYLSYNGEI